MDHREVAGAPPSRSTGGEFLLSLLQKSQPSIDPAVAAVGPSLQQSPLFPPNFFLQGFPQQQQPPPPQNQMRFGNLPSELFLNRTTTSSTDNNNNNNNRDLDLAMRNLDVSNKNSGLGFSGNSHSSSYNRRGNGDYRDNLELRNYTDLLLSRKTSDDNLGMDLPMGLMRNLDVSNRNSEMGFSKNQYNGRGNGDYHDNMEFERRNNAGLSRQDHGVTHHHHKSMQGGVMGRQEHDVNHHHQRSMQNGEHSRQVGNKSLNDDNWEMDGRGDSRLRQDHGVIHHSSVQDGQFSRQECSVGHRFSNDGELGRQERVVGHRSSNDSGFSRQERGGGADRMLQPRPPPGFSSNPRGGRNVGDKNGVFEDAKRNSGNIDQFDSRGGRNWDNGNRRRNSKQNVGGKTGGYGEFNTRINTPSDEFNSHGDAMRRREINDQFDIPGPPTGSKLHSVRVLGIEESLMKLHTETDEIANEHKQVETGNSNKDVDDHNENSNKKKAQSSRDKYARSDSRGNWLLSQKMRNLKKQMICRPDIDVLNAPFHKLYDILVPTEEEKAKQKQLMTKLEGLVCKEWPEAQLYLYGSCANSFGVSKSDIDVCLAIDDADINKSEFLMRLAEILESDNLQNVQALTRARVPIVKLMDPVSGISCDICINNVLAVVNTKLLRDYAQIDGRLRHLAFIVKHWAKSRGVNATYQGTLSSYTYVVMCIHFLQQRKPAILPCLQGLEPTYSVTVDDVTCTYFDRIDTLHGFGSHNKESIARLVWGFFIYWAYCHDYANNAISIRSGTIISKQSKDWTTRVGNDRHLICIEDPFEISHDLGRVVDKYSIKVLREEFERAAHIMQYDPNPCVNLFESYVPEGCLLNP